MSHRPSRAPRGVAVPGSPGLRSHRTGRRDKHHDGDDVDGDDDSEEAVLLSSGDAPRKGLTIRARGASSPSSPAGSIGPPRREIAATSSTVAPGGLKGVARVVYFVLHRFVMDHFLRTAPREFPECPPPPPRSEAIAAQADAGGPPSKVRLRVLTQNMWGLPICPDVEDRIEGFCRVLEAGEWDVVVTQETTMKNNILRVIECARIGGLKYHHHFIQGVGFPIWLDVMGTGVLVLSKYPIVDVQYKRYSANGKPYKIQHSDFFGAKGCGMVRLDLGPGAPPVDVYASHLHANYHTEERITTTVGGVVGAGGVAATNGEAGGDEKPVVDLRKDEYAGHRASQAWEAAKFIAATRCKSDPRALCIFAGDLNLDEGKAPLLMLQCLGGHLRDSWRDANPGRPLKEGYTYDAPGNTYATVGTLEAFGAASTISKERGGAASNASGGKTAADSAGSLGTTSGGDDVPEPERLDYILYSGAGGMASGWRVHSSEVQPFYARRRADGKLLSVSDHFALGTEMEWDASRASDPGSPPVSALERAPRSPESMDALAKCMAIVAAGLEDAVQRRFMHWLRALGVFTVFAIAALWTGSLNWLCVSCAIWGTVELIVSQWFCKDERWALQETLSQMSVTRNAMLALDK